MLFHNEYPVTCLHVQALEVHETDTLIEQLQVYLKTGVTLQSFLFY